MTALDYIKHYPWIKPRIFVPDYLKALAQNVLPERDIFNFTEMRAHYDPNKPTKTTKWDGHTSPMKIHLVDYAFLKLLDENPSIEHKNYLKVTPQSTIYTSNSVVITTGYTAKVREFPPEEINKISSWLISKNITPIFLGQTNTKTGVKHSIQGNFDSKVDFTNGINLIDKTSLLEAASIMENAKAVIGVDNGLLHLAGMTSKPIIMGFTTVSPEIRAPIRNNIQGHNCQYVTPDVTLGCRFCQQRTNFLYGHDYRNCLPQYKDYLCTKQMTAEKFIPHLEKLI